MEKAVRFAKICPNDFSNENRDYRELEVCYELGMEIIVFAKGEKKENNKYERKDHFILWRYSTSFLGAKVKGFKGIDRLISVFFLANTVRKWKPDIISGHDIICLTIGWMSNWFRKNQAKLIYDSHEFELGRNAKRNAFQRFFLKKWEKFMIKKSEIMILVNDSISDEVKSVHGLKERPLVIRNIPHRWEIDPEICHNIRKEILNDIGEGILFLYCGAVCENRGIEQAIQILSYDNQYRLLIMGNYQNESYFKKLMRTADELGVRSRIKYQTAVPYSLMWKYIGACDIGLILISGKARSYFLSLPNKLFECIQAGIPVLASDFPEISKIVKKYNIGVVCRPDSEEEIKKALDKVLQKEARDILEKNIFLAKEELCWENEKKKLINAYMKIM